MNLKEEKRQRRHKRIRSRVIGTATIPRLVVFRSLKNISAQLIDDSSSKTIASASTLKDKKKSGTVKLAEEIGMEIAKLAKEKSVMQCVFDRNGYNFHGQVKAVAEGARKGGLKF